MSHTQGKLVLSEDGLPELNNQNQIIESDSGALVVYHRFTNKQDARRLVACWNWCGGLSTETIETHVSAGRTAEDFAISSVGRESAIGAQRDAIKAQRDALLAALKELEAMAQRYRQPGYPLPYAQLAARAAIANAEKGGA